MHQRHHPVRNGIFGLVSGHKHMATHFPRKVKIIRREKLIFIYRQKEKHCPLQWSYGCCLWWLEFLAVKEIAHFNFPLEISWGLPFLRSYYTGQGKTWYSICLQDQERCICLLHLCLKLTWISYRSETNAIVRISNSSKIRNLIHSPKHQHKAD